VASAVVGGTVSELSGGKFGNGAQTGAFQFLFNQVVHQGVSARELARRKGDEILGPYLALDPNASADAHDYPIGPTPLCQRNEIGCGKALNNLIGENTVPMTWSYDGAGRYNLPYGSGVDPIIHYSPSRGIWINQTLEGHRYHDGRVVHAAYWSRGTYWLYSRGVGIGPSPWQNVNLGLVLFGSSHQSIQRAVRWQILKNRWNHE